MGRTHQIILVGKADYHSAAFVERHEEQPSPYVGICSIPAFALLLRLRSSYRFSLFVLPIKRICAIFVL